MRGSYHVSQTMWYGSSTDTRRSTERLPSMPRSKMTHSRAVPQLPSTVSLRRGVPSLRSARGASQKKVVTNNRSFFVRCSRSRATQSAASRLTISGSVKPRCLGQLDQQLVDDRLLVLQEAVVPVGEQRGGTPFGVRRVADVVREDAHLGPERLHGPEHAP